MKQRICFEVDGLAEDETGAPCPAGLCLTMDLKEEVPFDVLKKSININGILNLCCLDGMDEDRVRMITPEEFDEKYGDDEEDEEDVFDEDYMEDF